MNQDLSRLRCVVLGAGGFIGTNLCRSLADKVEMLRAFGRRQAFPDATPSSTWIPGDFSDTAAIAAAVDGMDVVFHLLSTSTPASSNIDKVADVQTNVIATLRLLEICRQQAVGRVVFVSSGGAIYGTPAIVPTPEDAPTAPLNSYGIVKLAIEKYLGLYEHLYGLDYRILRVSNPYGPYQTALRNQGAIAAFMSRALAGKPIDIWGDGSTMRDYVYISDVVDALELAASHTGSNTIFNIGSGTNHSLLQIAASIEALIGRKQEIRFSGVRKLDTQLSLLSIERARTDLDWQPKVNLSEGLELTLDWMKRQTP